MISLRRNCDVVSNRKSCPHLSQNETQQSLTPSSLPMFASVTTTLSPSTTFLFRIKPATIYGLLGPNGAGKTSTLRMMIGITVPDSGRVLILGEPLSRAHTNRFGYLPEERGLYKKMKVLPHLVLLAQLKGLTSAEASKRAHCLVRALGTDCLDGQESRRTLERHAAKSAVYRRDPSRSRIDRHGRALLRPRSRQRPGLERRLARTGQKRQDHSVIHPSHGSSRASLPVDLPHQSRPRRSAKAIWTGSKPPRAIAASRSSTTATPVSCASRSWSNPPTTTATMWKCASRPAPIPRNFCGWRASKARVDRFEVMQPSLEEIFIEAVSKPHA